MSLDTKEQELANIANAAMPNWFKSERSQEEIGMFAKMNGAAYKQAASWSEALFIETAEGFWLQQHAIDRATSRQGTGGVLETDAALRARLRNPSDALVLSAIRDAVQPVLDANGVTDPFFIAEIPRDATFLIDEVIQDTGIGGTFVNEGGGVFSFLPDVAFAFVPTAPPEGKIKKVQLTILGAASAGNDGSFETTGMVDNAAKFANGSGVAGYDATAAWATERLDYNDNILDNFASSYLYNVAETAPVNGGLADRCSSNGIAGLIVILPFASTNETIRLSVDAAIRGKKAAGVFVTVERRSV